MARRRGVRRLDGRPPAGPARRLDDPDLARGLPLRQADDQGRVRAQQALPADRAAQAAELDQGDRAEGGARLRGPRRGGQGRHHQALHRAPQPAWRARRRAGEADRARGAPVVLPALRPAPPDRRRDRALRPVLVQPRRRRTGDGLLHPGGVRGVHAPGARVRTDAGAQRHPPDQVLVLGVQGRAAHSVRHPPGRSRTPLEAQPDGPRLPRQVGRTTPRPRSRCSSTPTRRTRPGPS